METKGLTCKIPLELHSRITDEIQRTESTLGKFIEKIILEHYEREERNQMDKGRTLAFSISEELFQQIKGYHPLSEERYHRNKRIARTLLLIYDFVFVLFSVFQHKLIFIFSVSGAAVAALMIIPILKQWREKDV